MTWIVLWPTQLLSSNQVATSQYRGHTMTLADKLQQHNPRTHLNYVTSIKTIVDIDFYTGMLPYYHSKPKVGEYITYRKQ